MTETSFATVGDRSRWRRALPDVLGLAWVVAAGMALLLPALIHGIYLGPYDILGTNGLTAQHGVVVHNFSLRDQITLFIPFTEQAWTQVHQGHLPLWNPYNGLGMPLAFNWESAPFGLPALVGYVVPLRFAYTVGVLVTVVVAGTGGYVFGRVLRLGVIASAFIGTVLVLSGPMVGLLGWSATSVGSWMGWLFATAILVLRGERRGMPSLRSPSSSPSASTPAIRKLLCSCFSHWASSLLSCSLVERRSSEHPVRFFGPWSISPSAVSPAQHWPHRCCCRECS